jgi:beta-1,4-mannosyl-glycoprotein beta-1,4-N-acetylglucosaminyltransferase
MKPYKVYDCFCYFNEDMLLELRLKTLWDVVDVFVLVEATHQHSGHAKPLNFQSDRFKAYSSKLRYLVSTECPGGRTDPWANERAQRNAISKGLHDAQPEDRIIISDLDEIPTPTAISRYNPRKLRGDFQQQYLSYYLNNRLIEPARERIWHGSKITLYRHFATFFEGRAQSVRSFKSKGLLRSLKRTWFRTFNTHEIPDGGWHFTWVMTTQGIVEKMQATTHQENNREEWRDPQYIEKTIAEGRDLVRPDRRYMAMPIDESFPDILRTDLQNYSRFILPFHQDE